MVQTSGCGFSHSPFVVLPSFCCSVDWMSQDKKTKSQLMKLTKTDLVQEVISLRRQVSLAEASNRVLSENSQVNSYPLNMSETAISQQTAEVNSFEFLKLVVESAPQFIYWKNDRHEYLGCNLNFAKAAGFTSVEEVVGRRDEDMAWGEGDAEHYVRTDTEVMESNEPMLHAVLPFRSADGELRYIDSSKVPLRDRLGKVIGPDRIF